MSVNKKYMPILRSVAGAGTVDYHPDNGTACLPPGHRQEVDWIPRAIVAEFLALELVVTRGRSLFITEAGRAAVGVPAEPLLLDE